jgi:hypothetical protein
MRVGRKRIYVAMAFSNERFYVLDEGYRLILAPPPAPDDPLNALYDATTPSNVLPPVIDDAVKALTCGWQRRPPDREVSQSVGGLRVTVAPLQGPIGPHLAVRIERQRAGRSSASHSAA